MGELIFRIDRVMDETQKSRLFITALEQIEGFLEENEDLVVPHIKKRQTWPLGRLCTSVGLQCEGYVRNDKWVGFLGTERWTNQNPAR